MGTGNKFRLATLGTMHFSRFLAAWFKDWIALVNLVGSIVFLFWATLWTPSHEQAKYGLYILCVFCFVIGSYRIWAQQHQRVCELTAKTPIEAIDDLISEFEKLEKWYGSDEKTSPKPLGRLIQKSLDELRRHVPLAVYRFKKVAANPMPPTETFLPQTGRTIEQFADWRSSDANREECWRKASACLNALRDISRGLPH